MKEMSATEAQNRFGEFMDTALREGVILTRNGRKVLMVEPIGSAHLLNVMQKVAKTATLEGLTEEELKNILASVRAESK